MKDRMNSCMDMDMEIKMDMEWHGMKRNGMEWNGIGWDGMNMNMDMNMDMETDMKMNRTAE